MQDKLSNWVFNTKHPVKPILFWRATTKTGVIVDENNSIALLRHKYGNSVIYSVR